ncbi:MAG: hypothetical protein NWE76_05360 [Candidatus Bathyarchaeota archaeon]|nr:hypothetical protein [Candidatus Bathyarchaeota archaeon]
MRTRFVYWRSCPEFRFGEIIHYINEHAREITYKTFAKNADLEPLRDEDHPAMYRISAKDNWAVSFYKSRLPNGNLIYFFDWSRMEHIFVDPDQAIPTEEEMLDLIKRRRNSE